MKHVLYVLTLFFLVVILVTTSFAAGPQKSSRVPEEFRKYLDDATLSQWQAKLGRAALKNLADDDMPRPQTVSFKKFMDGSYRSVMSMAKFPQPPPMAPFAAPLAGTYHIGVAKNYATLTDAVNALNANGISASVVMVFDDASNPSSNPVVIGTITGASATKTVTFTAKSAVNVVLNFVMFNPLPYGIVLANAHYVTIDGTLQGGTLALGIDEAASTFPSGNMYAATIGIGNVTDNIGIKNMSITSIANAAVWNDVNDARSCIVLLNTAIGTSQINDVTISGCSFGRAYYGVLSTVPNGGIGVDGAELARATATVQRLKILNNKFGTNATGLQPCGQAIAVGGYASPSNGFAGGLAVEIAGNVSDGDQFNDDFEFFSTIFDEQVFRAGLAGPIEMWLSGDKTSSLHDNKVDNYKYALGAGGGFGNFAYSISMRSGSYINGPPVGYNNVITRMTSSDPSAFMFGTRTEGAHWHHNTSVANGTGGRNIAGRVRSGGNYENNIFLASSAGGSPRSVALRWEGGNGRHNVIAATPSFGPTRRLFYQFSSSTQYNNLAAQIALDRSDTTSSDQDPMLISDADLHINSAVPSGASNQGGVIASLTPLPNDHDGVARSATTPDAGAYEVSGVDALNVDGACQLIFAPSTAGTPFGVPVVPKALVSNLSNSSQTIPITLTIADGIYTPDVQNITLAAHTSGNVSFTTWTPPGNGPYTLTATTSLGSDGNATNNTSTRSQAIVPLLATYPQNFDFETGSQGWVGTNDWKLEGTAASPNIIGLGGAHGGAQAWVTDDGTGAGTYTAQRNNQLLSPFFSTVGLTNLYVNFFHSIRTEPTWDRSVFEYSLDTGKTWLVIGGLNDTNGINWYSENPYANAGNNTCYDGSLTGPPSGTAGTVQWPDASGLWVPSWTSNGDCGGDDLATGPTGYIFVQIKIPPGAINKPFVRFRYAAFSDASATDFGWAVDDVQFSTTPNTSVGSLSGEVYGDLNGNGVKDGLETGTDGLTVRLSGAATASVVTAGGGLYSFGGLIAGAYIVSVDHSIGTSVTQPYAPNVYHQLFGPGDVFTGKDFGTFNAGISGDPYRDDNGNGKKDGAEPGVLNWEIRAYNLADLEAFKQATAKGDKAALDALMVASAKTDAAGHYFLETKTGDYVIAEVLDSKWKNTQPGVAGTTILDNGDGTTTTVDVNGFYSPRHVDNITNQVGGGDFGNFKFGVIKVSSDIDFNGDGIRQPLEAGLSLPFGLTTQHQITKNGAPFMTVSLGNTVADVDLGGLDIGTYVVTETGATTPPLTPTLSSGHTTNIYSSGVVDEAIFLSFQNISISGRVYNDLDAGGTGAGDPGLPGWTVTLTGSSGVRSTTTDASGNYGFSNVPPNVPSTAPYALTEVRPAGWLSVAPSSGSIAINVNQFGTNQANKDFGNFHDNEKYRTWTVDELKGANEAKPVKRPFKIGAKPKPILGPPNSANMLVDLLTAPKLYPIVVGVPAQTTVGAKLKGYLMPGGQKDVYKTFNKGGIVHAGNPHPLSFYNDGIKRVLGKLKSLPADKQNNSLLANLLALKINLGASLSGQTDISHTLGTVAYCEANNPVGAAHTSLSQIGADLDAIMTNWDVMGEGAFTTPKYVMYDTIVAKINAAFSTGSTNDTSIVPVGGWTALKLRWALKSTLYSVPFLCAGSGDIAPLPPSGPYTPDVMPAQYALLQNYPNPFNPTTTISFDLPTSAVVSLKIYNLLGQEVATLLTDESFDAGNQEVDFDANALTSGVYFYRITVRSVDEDGIYTGDSFTKVKKMMLVK